MSAPRNIRIQPVWRETPDYALLALAFIQLAERLQEQERRQSEPASEKGGSDA